MSAVGGAGFWVRRNTAAGGVASSGDRADGGIVGGVAGDGQEGDAVVSGDTSIGGGEPERNEEADTPSSLISSNRVPPPLPAPSASTSSSNPLANSTNASNPHVPGVSAASSSFNSTRRLKLMSPQFSSTSKSVI
ncbi:hypothetical protein DIPPA_31321 [Diplonema papillatum]|nr:hypothetical protein DIPPA_31321 [Diplonema papillatum]